MLTSTQTAVRAPRSTFILWKWTGVSALLHVIVVGALCAVSYLGFTLRETEARNKAAAEEAAAKKTEAEEAAKSAGAATPPPATTEKPTASAPPAPIVAPVANSAALPPPAPNVAPTPAAPTAPGEPVSAEKILGIDKTAKPNETPKSPFAGSSDDDLLKDLK